MGYGTETKGYRLYIPESGRIQFSRDVIFTESSLGIEEEPNKPDNCVELDYPREKSISSNTEESTNEATEPVATEPSLRRSGRERSAPDYLGQ